MGDSERICITQFEQKEYDSFAYENEDIPGENTHTHTKLAFFYYMSTIQAAAKIGYYEYDTLSK